MKRLLISFLFLLFFSELNALVVFFPLGAKCNYLVVSFYPADILIRENRGAAYIGDSILNGEQVKVIWSNHFFIKGEFLLSGYTLIKQYGDTVFMRNNYMNDKWQILYNFAALPGHNWTNTFTVGSTVTGYTTTVNSVGSRIIGNDTLKELKVSYSNTLGDFGPGLITERIGSNGHLFNYRCNYHLHSENYVESLCYRDDDVGVIQFSSKPCNYSNRVGLIEQGESLNWNIYPNPANDVLNIETTEGSQIIISDINGIIVKQELLKESRKVNTTELVPGIYFLQIRQNSELVYKTKIIKE